ncbi:MAG: hypothetical protein JO322_05305 [Candidatus Eremiobacteraeota bacterium]|nr:hypothetical protein [Candidatus Eremiobacteraeota bacterium]
MFAGWVLAATLLVNVLDCMATNDARVVAVPTPPAWPVSPYYNYWDNGTEYYNPTILAPKPTLSIIFVNASDRLIREIVFGVYAGDSLVTEVRDAGRFSPGAKIRHDLRLRAEVFPLPSGALRCVPLSVTS